LLDLHLSLDLLCSFPDERENSEVSCVQSLKEKLDAIHRNAKQHLNFQSSRLKNRYNHKVKQIDFREGQSV